MPRTPASATKRFQAPRAPRTQRNPLVTSGIVRNVLAREIALKNTAAFHRETASVQFRDFRLQYEIDVTGDLKPDTNIPGMNPPTGRIPLERSQINEIVSARHMLFVLTQEGLCTAYDLDTRKCLCTINQADEIVRSLFYNKENDSLITISVRQDDNCTSLACRNTHLVHVERGQPDHTQPLFTTESLKWPGFVEFDDVNCKILTYSATNKKYKIWDLRSYQPLFEIDNANEKLEEIKLSPGAMLLIYKRSPNNIKLGVYDVETGAVMRTINHMLHRSKPIEFIEQFNEKILIKQNSEALQMIDAITNEIIVVPQTRFTTPNAFIFLYENQLFLTFTGGDVEVWNFLGQQVTTFEDNHLWDLKCNTNSIFINQAQSMMITYCWSRKGATNAATLPAGVINVADILSGKCIASLPMDDWTIPTKEGERRVNVGKITSLHYHEDRHEIYTGNSNGHIHFFSS